MQNPNFPIPDFAPRVRQRSHRGNEKRSMSKEKEKITLGDIEADYTIHIYTAARGGRGDLPRRSDVNKTTRT